MSKTWMAVYTKPRSEKKVAERLEKAGIEVYCPLQTVIKQWSDRKKKIKIPVFPSYVFVHVGESERLIPNASSISALPDLLVIARLPCFAT